MAVRGIYLSTPVRKIFHTPQPQVNERPVETTWRSYLARNGHEVNTFLVGGWTNPSEKYQSKWESSPNRAENKKIFENHHLGFFCCQNSFRSSKWVHGHSFRLKHFGGFCSSSGRKKLWRCFKNWNGYRMDFFWKVFPVKILEGKPGIFTVSIFQTW